MYYVYGLLQSSNGTQLPQFLKFSKFFSQNCSSELLDTFYHNFCRDLFNYWNFWRHRCSRMLLFHVQGSNYILCDMIQPAFPTLYFVLVHMVLYVEKLCRQYFSWPAEPCIVHHHPSFVLHWTCANFFNFDSHIYMIANASFILLLMCIKFLETYYSTLHIFRKMGPLLLGVVCTYYHVT